MIGVIEVASDGEVEVATIPVLTAIAGGVVVDRSCPSLCFPLHTILPRSHVHVE